MEKKVSIIVTALFGLMIISVPVIQVFYEISQKERVQALDLLTDTFITPARRSASLKNALSQLIDSCNTIQTVSTATAGNPERMTTCSDNILTGMESLRQLSIEINRHITDSSSDMTNDIDTLLVQAHSLQEAVDDERYDAAGQAANKLAAAALQMRLKYAGNSTIPALLGGIVQAIFRTTVFSTHYIRAYEKTLEDHSIVAQTLRPVMQFLRYALFRDLGDKVLAGKRQWLFYRPDVEYLYRPSIFDRRSRITDYNDRAFTDDPLAVIVDFKEQLARKGIDLLMVIVPGKPSVYPDMLAPCDPPVINDKWSPSLEFIDSLKYHHIAAVDLFTPFYEERRYDTPEKDSFYLARDTHWKSRGLRLAAREVANAIKKYPWYSDVHRSVTYSLDSVVIQREGDIGNMTDLMNNPCERLRIMFPTEATTCYPVSLTYKDDGGNVLRKELYRDDFTNARILILGDSFSRIYQTDAPGGAGWIAHLAYELSEPLVSLINDGGASTLVREKLARKSSVLDGKQLVVWEFVERDIRYGAYGWKVVNLP